PPSFPPRRSSDLNSGNVSVRLPARWRARLRGDADPRVIAQAAENAPGEPGRMIQVLADRVDHPLSPLQYLCENFGIVPAEQADVATMDVSHYPGVVVSLENGRTSARGP